MSSVMITKLQWGPENIDDTKTLSLVAACIENFIDLTASNMTMGRDTQVGVVKTAYVEYVLNGLAKARTAKEGSKFLFSWDIETVQYGADGSGNHWLSNDYYKDKPLLIKPLLASLDTGSSFSVDNSHFLANNPGDDPAVGTVKQLKVTYVQHKNPGRNYRQYGSSPTDWVATSTSFNEYTTDTFKK